MSTQLTVIRMIREARREIDVCRAKLEEAQSDIQDLDIQDPDQSETFDQLWIDIDDALYGIHQIDESLAQYATTGD